MSQFAPIDIECGDESFVIQVRTYENAADFAAVNGMDPEAYLEMSQIKKATQAARIAFSRTEGGTTEKVLAAQAAALGSVLVKSQSKSRKATQAIRGLAERLEEEGDELTLSAAEVRSLIAESGISVPTASGTAPGLVAE